MAAIEIPARLAEKSIMSADLGPASCISSIIPANRMVLRNTQAARTLGNVSKLAAVIKSDPTKCPTLSAWVYISHLKSSQAAVSVDESNAITKDIRQIRAIHMDVERPIVK